MADQENNTPGMTETQNAVNFINETVLKPDADPMTGMASPMIEQATGMMVQDLQSFLKGFEQVGLVALARLADNILTYGTYFGPKTSSDAEGGGSTPKVAPQSTSQTNFETVGSDAMKGLFSMVGDYGKAKAQMSSLLSNMKQDVTDLTKDFSELDDTDAKKKSMNKT